MKKNLYEELGLKQNASKSEIKSSYRSLVKQHHPDAGGEKERFLAIQNAWETLNDPIKKEQYDRTLVPRSISALGLDLYYCFSQVKDALSEVDRYTQGYVDDYLFDGKEMIKEAKIIQSKMSKQKKIKTFR